MQELETLIEQAALGNPHAFETIVYRFQDMAVGYAYSVLGDFHLAEDAAQEAFVQIHQTMGQLREPKAFASWFRTVIYKQCDRLTRRKRLRDVSLETMLTLCEPRPSPVELVERNELQQAVQDALLLLPTAQQQVIVLFYIADYSQKEISSFLDVPLTAVVFACFQLSFTGNEYAPFPPAPAHAPRRGGSGDSPAHSGQGDRGIVFPDPVPVPGRNQACR